MTEANVHPARAVVPRACAAAALVLGLGLAALGGKAPPPAETPKEPSVGGIALFAGWPQNQKPDAVVVLSGQTFGFLQPCGCSRPQFGGLERRAVFINSLKAKGWPVAAADLGDLFPPKSVVEDQAFLKYKTTMNALREMGYVAVGVGKTDLTAPNGIDRLLGEYAVQKEQPPFLLAGNMQGIAGGKPIPREQRFPPVDPAKSNRPMIGAAEVAVIGNVPVGIVGAVGKALGDEVKKGDPLLDFVGNAGFLKAATDGLAAHPHKPQLNVLLYQGTADEAKALAPAHPQFQVILCQSEDPEPPQFPTSVNNGNTLIVQVGHKGRYVGVVGAFRKAAGGFDLKYQLVPLSEWYVTPGTEDEARKANFVLPLYERYAETVRDRKYLEKVPRVPHPAQVAQPKLNLSYIGSERCQNCHAGQFVKWKGTPHSHALDTLETKAKRPGLRNFDGECVVCHVVGLDRPTGFATREKTPELAHVGCESCHGPGSGHATNDKNAALLALQMPWRQKAEEKLPDIPTMKKMAEVSLVERNAAEQKLPPAQLKAINAVSAMCMKCHDMENDPHFDIYKYWPKVFHPSPPKPVP